MSVRGSLAVLADGLALAACGPDSSQIIVDFSGS